MKNTSTKKTKGSSTAMGMAASQARFLGLTARKNNVEFEGQQINQQRTTLSNQSANYYNNLLGMSVPVPPSVDDYTKTVYTFEDGALTNQITAMIAQPNGDYTVSYLRQWTDDFSVVSATTSIVNGGQAGPWKVGAKTLRELGSIDDIIELNYATCTKEDINNFVYFLVDDKGDMTELTKNENGQFVDASGTVKPGITENSENLIIALIGNKFGNSDYDICLVTKEADGSYTKEVYSIEDEYLKTLSADQLQNLLKEEQEYIELLKNKYGADSEYMVRYIKNTTTGEYEPYFYKKADLTGANYDENGNSLSNINCYKIGSETKSEEVKALPGCKIEKDSSGRYINIKIPAYDENGTPNIDKGITYALTTSTVTDQAAYEDAMNQYEYEKYEYDQAIQEINAKIEIVQSQDKNLELRLKQLDTEQKAISTEIDAVSQVIQKNTEASFKTFG